MGIFVLLFLAATLIIIGGTLALIQGLEHPPRRTLGWALAQGLAQDPGEMGFEFIEESISFSDGSHTPAWIVDGQCAHGPIVVVSHGFGDSRFGALTAAPILAKYASKMVFYDLRAHGDSTAPISRLGTTEADDLLTMVHEIQAGRWRKKTSDTQRVPIVLYGASMGAGISISAASRDESGAVAGVIAEGPYRGPTEAVAGFLRTRSWPRFPFTFFAFEHIRFWRGGYAEFDRVLLAGRLKCPLLVLAGKRDPICRFESAEQIAAAAKDATLVAFDEGTHLDLAAVDQARYLGALSDFFDRILKEKNSDNHRIQN